jgi:hypothetical protein
MKSVSLFIRDHKEQSAAVLFALLMAVGYVVYMFRLYGHEVFYLASFMGDIQFVGRYLAGNASAADFFRPFGEHGLLGYRLITLINVELFKYTSLFEFWINIANVLIVLAMFLIWCLPYLKSGSPWQALTLILLIIILLNPMQGSSISMETQVRLGILFFLFMLPVADRVLRNSYGPWDLVVFGTTSVLAINVFGTAYSVAGSFAILLVAFVFALKKSQFKQLGIILAVFTVCWSLYVVSYGLLDVSLTDDALSDTTRPQIKLSAWLLAPYALAQFFGSALLGYAPIADGYVPSALYGIAGVIMFLISLWALGTTLKTQKQAHIAIPAMCLLYTFFVGCLVLVGRLELLGVQVLTNNWYHVHTKVGTAATFWLLMILLACPVISRQQKMIARVSVALIALTLLCGLFHEARRSPHVRAYWSNLATAMLMNPNDIDELSTKHTALLATPKETKQGLMILREHRLSAFSKTEANTGAAVESIGPKSPVAP